MKFKKPIPVIIQARMSSERLLGKVLRSVRGKPMIEYLLDRLKQSKRIDRIIIATSKDKTDQPIVDYCRQNNIQCFKGDLNNVAGRFKDIIENERIESFVRICADSPLIDSNIIDAGIEIFKNEKYEIVTNILRRTFPKGQSFEILCSDTFIKGYKNIGYSNESETDNNKNSGELHINTDFFDSSEKKRLRKTRIKRSMEKLS